MRVFVAGAWGAIGRFLCPLLVAEGHQITGTTRSLERAAALREAGVSPVLVDVYDAPALHRFVALARPEVVIHQLTDLAHLLAPGAPGPANLAGNARIRVEGTRNLIAAAVSVGASRVVAQSICWLYAEGPLPHLEADPLHRPDDGSDTAGVDAVLALETAVTATPGIEGLALRYGRFYGPCTGVDAPRAAPVHVEAAAHAALLAVTRGEPGIYNIAEDDGYVSTQRARAQLGWNPEFRVPSSPQEARR